MGGRFRCSMVRNKLDGQFTNQIKNHTAEMKKYEDINLGTSYRR